MDATSIMSALGGLGVFPSRAFVPAFGTACLLRYGPLIGLASHKTVPSWFTSDISLVVLGLLTLLEVWATKSSDLRILLDTFDGYLKSGMSFLTTIGLVSTQDAQFVQSIQQAGFTDATLGVFVAGGVFALSIARHSFFDLITEIDPDDSLGLHRFVSWLEEAWVVSGVLLLLVLPVLMLLLTAIVFAGVYALERTYRRREESRRIACRQCQTSMYPSAVACPQCRTPNDRCCAVGLFGQSRVEVPADPARQRWHLLEVGRCSVCATRFKQSTPRQTCVTCQAPAFATEGDFQAYLAHIDARRFRVLGVATLLGIIPLVGVIPAIVYYRLQIVRPLRRYVPTGVSWLGKWFVRLLSFIALALQWIPLAGMLLLPLMAWINYSVYRRAFVYCWSPPVPPPPPPA